LPLYEEVVSVEEALRSKRNKKGGPTHVVATNMSMCQVVPAWKIGDLLNCGEMRRLYEEAEDKVAPDVIEDVKRSASRKSKGQR